YYLQPDAYALTLRGRLSRGTRLIIQSCDIQQISTREAILFSAEQVRENKAAIGQDTSTVYDDLRRNVNSLDVQQAIEAYRRLYQFPVDPYTAWMNRYDVITNSARQAMSRTIGSLQNPPKFSIVMPTYNTPARFLHAVIHSVERQVYPHWELCIADDASSQPHVAEILCAAEKRDPRIKLCLRKENGHISAASNSAIRLATAPWIVLLDHDDEIPEHALFVMAQAIAQNPNAKLFYSDEDKCDEKGNRKEPYFKPGFAPDLLRGQNYVSHLGIYARDIVEKIGGFRSSLDGSQDYDLLLRAVECISADQIVHVPHILYHWRMIEGSAAAGPQDRRG
ncbi:MAG: glycosyltransferase, partial [Cytophagaceae bacterium]